MSDSPQSTFPALQIATYKHSTNCRWQNSRYGLKFWQFTREFRWHEVRVRAEVSLVSGLALELSALLTPGDDLRFVRSEPDWANKGFVFRSIAALLFGLPEIWKGLYPTVYRYTVYRTGTMQPTDIMGPFDVSVIKRILSNNWNPVQGKSIHIITFSNLKKSHWFDILTIKGLRLSGKKVLWHHWDI